MINYENKIVGDVKKKTTTTHTRRQKDWSQSLTKAYVYGVEPKCKKFHYDSIRVNNLIKYLFYKSLLDENLCYKYFIQ